MGKGKVVRANKSQTVDLESEWLKIEEGKTYLDDGTTVSTFTSKLGWLTVRLN